MANIRQNSDLRFWAKVANFPRNLYKIDDRNSHIFNLMYSILENGVGQVKGMVDIANESQGSLAGTQGPELDKFFQIFGIKRDPELIYQGDISSSLNFNNITEFKSLDSKFRIAIAKMLQAVQKGGRPDGLRLMAEATSSYQVQVIEPWQILTNLVRLRKDDNTAALNEVIIVVLPDKVLSEIEQEVLKAKLIANLEMIRPYGTLLTIQIVNPPSDNDTIVPDYAISGQFVFLSDGSNQYVELLSREKEIHINSFVVDGNSFEVDTEYSTLVGELVEDLDDIIIVNQAIDPFTPVFLALITNGEDSEIVLVYNQSSYHKLVYNSQTQQNEDKTFFIYEVLRNRLGTSKIDWNEVSGDIKIYVNLIKSDVVSEPESDTAAPTLPIPTADSPDNYPEGKATDDPTKYDSNGDYAFEWSSQSEFADWFKTQVIKAGGEVIGNSYRMSKEDRISVKNPVIAALGLPNKIIRPIVRPKSNE